MSFNSFWSKFAQADYVAVPVNTVGVMGAGLAKAIKTHMSKSEFSEYLSLCETTAFPGDSLMSSGKWIFCFTKKHWKQPSKPEWIESCVKNLISLSNKDKTLLLPTLGAGLGGLPVETVRGYINQYLPEMKWKEVYLT